MKQFRTILLLLAVCFTQATFSQSSSLVQKWDEERKLKANIAEVLANADTPEEVDANIEELLRKNGSYMTAEEKQNTASKYFEKCKSKLSKLEEKLAAGKKISTYDAMEAANYYVLGYKKICDQNYSKALEYLKLCPQIPLTKMYEVAIKYKQDKDKAAAKAAMNFIDKPSPELSKVADLFGLSDVYQEEMLSLIADKKQEIRRAIRSKDSETLLHYIPYDINEVDSFFAYNPGGIVIAKKVSSNGNYYQDRSIYDVEDFDDRSEIKIFQNGDDERRWSAPRNLSDYFINKGIYKHQKGWALS